ncbi:MAG: NAD(P)H-hydrate dehydratase [Desulfobacterales bacterium]|nr:NAD(P)H-hydrate dehydratase [Desulfobacterales bacterium]
MDLLTADEMREMDRQTIESFGLPGRILMENAGQGATRVLMTRYPDIASYAVGVVAGRGNNGGDGFVIARCLYQHGVDVRVYLLSKSVKLQGDAAENFHLLTALGVPVAEIPDEESFARHRNEMAHRQIWVDAILGTGLNSDVRGFFKTVIEFINSTRRPVFSVDIPSGLHTDTGRPCGVCIAAVLTATFGFAKIGHIQLPGAEYTGELHVIDIGIPPYIARETNPRQHLITPADIRQKIEPRPTDMHKGGTGHLLIVAGAPGKTGAAAMSALSAMRAGAGLVTLGVPESLNPVIEPQVLEPMTIGLQETPAGALSDDAADTILDLLSDKRCLALGPGMGTDPATARLVHRLIQESPVPVVVDADGLNNLALEPEILINAHSPVILTPHPGEMARLTKQTPKDVQADRVGCARWFAESYKVHLVLKGARTVIAAPDGHIHINPAGNPGMASGGMGDVLTGLISGLVCQGYAPETAAQIGVFVHGAAADDLADTMGPFGYLASDVMNQLPMTIKHLMGEAPLPEAYTCRMPINA